MWSRFHTPLTGLLAAAALVLLFGFVPPALAAGISVEPTYGNFDTTFTFSASGFKPNEIVDTWVGLPDLSAVSTGIKHADGSGNLSWSFKPKPSQGGGEYIAVASGRVSGEVSVKFNVVAPPETANGDTTNGETQPKPVYVAPISERTVEFTARGYLPGELVNTWYLAPNGTVNAYNNFYADAWGNLSFQFTVGPSWMYGGYQLVGRGVRSGNTQWITFSWFGTVSDVRASMPIESPAPYFDFVQGGYTPNESVSIWIGMPNGLTQGLAIVNANGSGVVNYRVNIQPGWLYGGYIVAGYGWRSHATYWQRFSYFGEVSRLYP